VRTIRRSGELKRDTSVLRVGVSDREGLRSLTRRDDPQREIENVSVAEGTLRSSKKERSSTVIGGKDGWATILPEQRF
jgi:hypothetical protein